MHDVKKTLLSGTFYTAIARYSGLFIQIFLSAILARLISPEDFGVIAIATVIIMFLEVLSNFGITPAIVQNKNLDNNDLSHIFSFTVYSALIASLLFFFGSWGIASFYKNQSLLYVCQLLSIKVLFTALSYVPNALLLKDKRFKFIAIRTFSLMVITGILAVIAAHNGYGIYSLLITPILTGILMFFISFYQYKLIFIFKPRWNSIKKIFEFSLFQFLSNFLNYFSRNMDKLLIGKFLSMSQLGYYEKSYKLMMMPIQNITHVITPVMHPVFSDFQDNKKELAYKYLKVIQLIAIIGFPLSVYLFFNANELISIVYGDQWQPAIPVFQALSISVGFQMLLSSTGAIFQSANATRLMFWREVFSMTMVLIALFSTLMIFKTIVIVAYGYVFAMIINFIQCYYVLFKRLDIYVFKLYKTIWKSIVLSLILIVLMLLLNKFLVIQNLLLFLFIKSFVWGITILSFIHIFKIYSLKKILEYIKNKQ